MMLRLRDFFHLDAVDTFVAEITGGGPGLIVVAGLDPRAEHQELASGRGTLLRILMREFMESHPAARCMTVGEGPGVLRVPRAFRDRAESLVVRPPYTWASRIAEAAQRRPDLLVIDRLDSESIPAALDAARSGRRVLSQVDTLFRGAGVVRQLRHLGASRETLDGLAWIVSVQRMPTLCPHCKRPAPLDSDLLSHLRDRFPHVRNLAAAGYVRADGCEHCGQTGYHGTVMAFDIFRAGSKSGRESGGLPMADYALRLAQLGYLSPDDALHFEADRFQRMYDLLVSGERALADSNAALERKLAELETAHHVLEQRTEALISLQEIGQSLLASTDLGDLAKQVCRRARDLCGADRAILYWLHDDDRAEVLAVSGWDDELAHQPVDAALVREIAAGPDPTRYRRWPPGVESRGPLEDGFTLRAGLAVPLHAEDRCIGAMIVHTTRRANFEPGESALFQTFAHQAALAIQRAGLIQQLWDQIAALEAAQAELAQKERMERELELARQVQQSVLPKTFPQVPGFRFAARNEPARQVGGDFYDVIWLDDDHFGVAVADVSDKGLASALYMALTRSLLLAEARRARSPSAVLINVNDLLLELGQPNMFVTVLYGVVERAARRLTYARGGHDYPLLLRDGHAQELHGQGMVLGLLPSDRMRVENETIMLHPGDRLVLYTDGLTDVMNPDNALYGADRFTALLLDLLDQPTEDLCAAIFEALAEYRGSAPQFDDMTLLVVDVE
ncbi:MAG: SpoIIE family protein phosphatase [Anaerolineae bacterium]|nr:SpoIIE family protein phosphatase [Anaerolineae bacterium]